MEPEEVVLGFRISFWTFKHQNLRRHHETGSLLEWGSPREQPGHQPGCTLLLYAVPWALDDI